MSIDFIVYIAGFITVYICGVIGLSKHADEVKDEIETSLFLVVTSLFSWLGFLLILSIYFIKRHQK